MTIKASAILVDRLAHALESHGVEMKRRALLETAAYAFAYNSSNAFTAAATAGDINPPPVTVIGRLELPDGQTLIVVNDPLANSAYGIDETFIEQVVDEERRERIGVTPYGHLVRVDHLGAEVDVLDLSTPQSMEDLASITGIIRDARKRIDGYTALDGLDATGQAETDTVGQAELALERAFDACDFGNRRQTIYELRHADELLALVLNDDAERHVLWCRDTIAEALKSISQIDAPRTSAVMSSDGALKPILMSALREIDQEIENREAGGDPAAWKDLKRISDIGHAAARDVSVVTPLDDDADSIRVSREDLKLLLKAARSQSEDVRSGIEDGIYEEEQNQDIDAIDRSIANIAIRLDMDVPPLPRKDVSPRHGMLTVHVARIVHSHGSDIRVALTEEALDAQVAEYCRETWDEVSDLKGIPSDTAGMSDREVVSTYYGALEESESEDFLDETTIDVPMPGSSNTAHDGECARCGLPLDTAGLCTDRDTCPFSERKQDDAQGWVGHPERDPNPREDGMPIPTAASSPLGGFTDADEIAAELENGASADIFYDAHEFGEDDEEDPDRIAENTIERTQNAMMAAARMLRDLKPTVLADGSIIVNGVMQSKTAIAERAKRDARDELRYVTYHDGSEGDVTVSMVAAMGLPYVNERGDGIPLTDEEHRWLGVGDVLNEDRELPVKLGASALWHRRKWLVAEIDFAFPDQGDDSHDDASALRRAQRHMEHIAPYVKAMGGLMHLDEDATEFGHELAVLIPFEFAMESESLDDWYAALAYALSTAEEKKAGMRVTGEYTAQQAVGESVYSIEPAGDTVWDATVDALRWGRKHALDIHEGDFSYPDDYAHSPFAPEWVRERSASHPFEVQAIGLGSLYGIEGTWN